MKHKLIVAALFILIASTGCRSRFTSTSDSTGPRRHIYADPSEKNNDHSLQTAEQTLDEPQKTIRDTTQSGLVKDTVGARAVGIPTDSIQGMPNQ